jgi:hypothetical protein
MHPADAPERSDEAVPSGTSATPPVESLAWTLHPIRHQPARTVLLAGVTLFVGWAVAVRWEMPGLAAVAVLVLLVSASPHLLPTRFRLDDAGVRIRFLGTERHRAWADLKRYREAKEGVLLSPLGRRSLLDETRGLFLRFAPAGDGRREAVMGVVRRRIPRPEARDG